MAHRASPELAGGLFFWGGNIIEGGPVARYDTSRYNVGSFTWCAMPLEARRLQFTFDGDFDSAHAVPADILIQFLSGARKALYLFGLQFEGKNLRERLRFSQEIERKYSLQIFAPEKGSLVLPAVVGAAPENLLDIEKVSKVVHGFKDFGEALSMNNVAKVTELVPDSRFRRAILDSFRTLAPQPGSGWHVDISNAEGTPVRIAESVHVAVANLVVPIDERKEQLTVTGRVEEINFTERKISIIYPPTKKTLECFYTDDVEEMLIERRRDMIQITGSVVLDSPGEHPIKIIEVSDIRDLDLSIFRVASVPFDGKVLRFSAPLEVEPTLSEDKQYIVLEDDTLHISVAGRTRDEVLAELQQEIAMLWREYALEEDSNLDTLAREFKVVLLTKISEVAA